ncbi:electron transporter [Methylobacterium sp. Gmos1]
MRVSGIRPARLGLAALLALLAHPAAAGLSPKDLSGVALSPPPGARAPLDAAFTDSADGRRLSLGEALAGRPALLMPLDYACRNVCDPMLAVAGTALAATGLVPGRDYRLVTLGINPRADSAARAMVAEQLGSGPLIAGAAVLTGAPGSVEAVTRAVGYTYAYDRDTDSYAHPAGALVLTGDGRVARALSPLAMTARDLRLALVEAGDGRVGGLADRLVLLCYGYDPQTGVYTPLIRRILAASGAVTVAGIAGLVLVLHRRSRRTTAA